MKIQKRNLLSIHFYALKPSLKSNFLKSEKIRKNHRKKNCENLIPKEKKKTNDVFLLVKDFSSYLVTNFFLFEGSFEVEFFSLPFINSPFEIGLGFYKKKSNSNFPFDCGVVYDTITGLLKMRNFIYGKEECLGSGEILKCQIILPLLKTSDRCLIQEITYLNNFEEYIKNKNIKSNLFSIKKSKKKYYKNGQSFFRLISSKQIGGEVLNFFSQFPFLAKINFGPEYRFQGKRDLNFF